MCRGYHRRQTERWRHTREHITALFNVNRAPDTPALLASEVMPLDGDAQASSTTLNTPEEVENLWALLDARDAAILS